jgi:alpha-glucoside transport system substrate-binding protein
MSQRTRRRGAILWAGTTVLTLFLGACSGGHGGGGGETTGAQVDCSKMKGYGNLSGKTVTIASSTTGLEAQRFEKSFRSFERCTGVNIVWKGTAKFEDNLVADVGKGTPPNLALIPQPGLLRTLVREGHVKKPTAAVTAVSKQKYSQDWLDYGTVDGVFYAPPLGANVKSLVWYSPKVFEKNGLVVPNSWDDLVLVSKQLKEKGITPWCAGFASGDSSGWPGTDWVEDVMLRMYGPDVYDAWVDHDIPFDDPRVQKAFDTVGSFIKNDDNVGDVSAVATTSWQEAGYPVVEGTCGFMRQASFYSSQWSSYSSSLTVAPDGDVYAFALPPINSKFGRPVMGASQFLAAFDTDAATQAVQLYLQTDEYVNMKAELGDWISPSTGLKESSVPDLINQLGLEMLLDRATVFRFDASDQMPAAVGSGTFWSGMLSWIQGESTATVTRRIEKSWPRN